ncbi:MAG: hypothetical protein JRH11_03020, partial [Deltaproteobacteria bacterium]|nr:hypothetical protein [Deltaproteobacteria bacterium]
MCKPATRLLLVLLLFLPLSALLLFLPQWGCSDGSEETDSGTPATDSGGADTAADTATAACLPGVGTPETVALTTDDGVSLEADFHSSGLAGGGAAILLHMIPPSNNRSNYPVDFIQRLTDRGIAVINTNRRGAVAADGVSAQDAYQGPTGWLDAKAAFDFIGAHACGFDTTRIVLVGASNGTTTAFDFVAETAADPDRGARALVFLTGGGYTENQRQINDQRAVLDPLPIRFVYSTAEAAWSQGFEAGAPSPWV